MNNKMRARWVAGPVAVVTLLLVAGGATANTIDYPIPDTLDFTTSIDNAYWPMPSGMTFAYMAETEDGCEYGKVTITDEEMSVNGYTTLKVRDQEWESGDCDIASATLVEDTHDYYAMEKQSKNIWYFGEDTWSVDEDTGLCTDEGAWLAGEFDAEAGIIMLGDPKPGDRYQQEYWEDEAEDWGAVLRLNARVSIDIGDFEDCLVTREWTPLEPGSIEQKYYCPEATDPGPGLVYIRELKGKTVHVEYIGPDFGVNAPGEYMEFPAVGKIGSCTMP